MKTAEKLFRERTGLTGDPVCAVCGKKVEFNGKFFPKFCSKPCRFSKRGNEIAQEIRTKTNIEKYGNAQPIKNPEVAEKRKKTLIAKYGVDNIFKTKEGQEKARAGVKRSLGVEHALQNKETKKKQEETMLKKYGVSNPGHSKELREKTKETCRERYGVDHVLSGGTELREKISQRAAEYLEEHKDEIVSKRKKTNLEKYGVVTPLLSEKSKETLNRNWGVSNPFSSSEIRERIVENKRKNYWDTFLILLKNKNIEPQFGVDVYTKFSQTDVKKYKCLKCGEIFETELIHVQHIHCPGNGCIFRSKHETLLFDELINTFSLSNEKIVARKRFGHMELDIFIPDLNLGIEYDGMFWHSELYKDRNYHKDKTEFFNNSGIKVLHVYESDYLNRHAQILDVIRSSLKIPPKSIYYARECSLREVNNDLYKNFCDRNHIRGFAPAEVRLGLFYEEELVEVMSFSKPRFNPKFEYENIRTCSKLDTGIVGGFNRLLRHFIENYHPKSIISYVDRALFTGDSYRNAGFELHGLTDPDFYYFDKRLALYNRVTFQKHKLKDKLPMFDPDKTEHENMLQNGYLRFYDCGNFIFTLIVGELKKLDQKSTLVKKSPGNYPGATE